MKNDKKRAVKTAENDNKASISTIWAYIAAFLFFVLLFWIGYYFFYDNQEAVDTAREESVVVQLTDEQIRGNIEDQLVWDSRVFSENVTVSVTNGRVTLVGSVPTYIAKKSAGQSTHDVVGVVSVDNELVVEIPPNDQIPEDKEITSRVESIVMWNPDLEAGDIDVDVNDGVVSLEGTVDSLWKQTLAEEIVYNIEGVYDVDNKLAVVYTEDVTDESIAENVVKAYERNVALDVEDIDVRVTDGEVTLSGKVDSLFEANEAVDIAFFTIGVISVNNQLEVAN